MAVRANPRFLEELELYGAEDVTKCYHCGNCSAVCPFSKEPFIFPRRSMRYLQMGLDTKLRGNLEPWLCYYCGECSEQCPREAEPGETMMSMRRWLTSQYDATGISRLFYRSWKAELAAILLVAVLTGIGFVTLGFTVGGGDLGIYAGEKAFLPSWAVHLFDWSLALVLSALLLTNCVRMWWFTVGSDRRTRVPLWTYVRKAWVLPLHFMTQKRYRECDKKAPWAVHLTLMLSYVTMLILIMFFLHAMHAPETIWAAHGFGYLATIGLLGTTIYAIRGRIKKREPHYAHSHETDWMFLILLVYVAATGILQSALYRWFGADAAANVVYIAHMMGVVPMLALEVPFSKWSHLAYRPLAMYFAELQADAMRAEDPALRPAVVA
ncbi:MAG: 4Fe-4S dicluster domain-containing protein [Acidobacteria bacterium]|nr:4Fe-4S dicluster domain-containing protein [Acidobacteriota bacterium]